MGEVIVFPWYMDEFSGACRCAESLRTQYSFTVSPPGNLGRLSAQYYSKSKIDKLKFALYFFFAKGKMTILPNT
jgi:hypothetical protein